MRLRHETVETYPLRLPVDLDRRLRRRARREGRTLRAVLVELLEAAMDAESAA